jgi:polyisoprenoid-binding protein YceI
MEPTAAARSLGGIELPAAGAWSIDPDYTSVRFVCHHLGRFALHGRFTAVEGQIRIADDPAESQVEATIATTSATLGALRLDHGLRSSDHLDVERHPTAFFRSTQVRWRGLHARVSGELTMLDVTNSLVLDVRYRGTVVDPWGVERAGFSAIGTVDREDWGLSWNVTLGNGALLVSRRIRIDIDVEAVRQPASTRDAPP